MTTDMQAPTEIYVWIVPTKWGDGGSSFTRAWTDDPSRAQGLRDSIGLEPAVYRLASRPDAQDDERFVKSPGVPEDLIDAVSIALRRAWELGQTYWRQADSKSWTQQAKSSETQEKFGALVDETRAALAAAPAPVSEPEQPPAENSAVRNKIAAALHYPEHWDTAAYPTLDDAAWEAIAAAKLTCSECAEQPSQDEAGLSERIIHAVEGECDGLAITEEQASNILAYLQYGAPMDDMRRDAERYRKLRSADISAVHKGGVFAGLTPDNVVINGDDLDIAVDLLIDASPTEQPSERGDQECPHGVDDGACKQCYGEAVRGEQGGAKG